MLNWLTLILFLALTACVPATFPAAPATTTPAPVSDTLEPVPTETVPAENPSEIPIIEATATKTPVPTQTEWELAQQQVIRLRNFLDSYSDGYNGLSIALEQTEPNKAWCDGLTMAINDFDYLKDAESSKTLQDLKGAYACP